MNATGTWTRRGSTFTLNLVIPANATATVHIPTRDPATVMEGGLPAGRATGVAFAPPHFSVRGSGWHEDQ